MKAVILVGGEGTRLRPLTCNIPKAMVPVVNKPFLEHVIGNLAKHGIKDIILAKGHLAGPIAEYLGDGTQLGVRLTFVVEDTPLGTAGAFKNVASYLDETFLALNGDIFTDLDYTGVLSFHRQRRAKATITLAPVEDPTAYGVIETDEQGRVGRFLEKPAPGEVTTNMINAGTYVLEPEVLAEIPPQVKVSIERETFPLLLDRGDPVYAYSSPGYWMDMGTPQKYLQLHRDLLNGKCRHYAPTSGAGVVTGTQINIHPAAQITGPVLIGNNCTIEQNVRLIGPVVIGDGCHLLEGALIEDSVIWHNVQLGRQVELKHSIVADHCHLLDGCSVEDSVLGDNVTVVSGGKLAADSKIWPGETVKTGKG